MSTAIYMVCEECKQSSYPILTHSCLWKKSSCYQENFSSFIVRHFDKGCNYKNFRMIQEGDEDEKNYTIDKKS